MATETHKRQINARSTGADGRALLEFERKRLALFAHRGFEGESQWVTDRRGRRVYLIRGGHGLRPTVLIHGGLSEAGIWCPLAGRLAGDLVIPDRPGCGLSYRIDYRRVGDYRGAAVDWLLDVVDALGVDEIDLVGSSMGGFFSIAFALAHPGRVRRLGLVGAPAGLDRRAPLFVRLWGSPITGPLITRMGITDPEELRSRVFARLLVARPEAVPLDYLETALAARMLPGAGRAAQTMLRSFLTLRGVRREILVRESMVGLPVPTLFVWGDSDKFASPSSGRELAARMPDARVEAIAGAGHLPWFDRLEAVATALGDFLAGEASDRQPRQPATP
ncbi:MAG TPA: alpha/beta hydrolase [Thermoleophilaceae bacterium]|nr:alpha/beta hydrolase [Thermoleophilaceae bacterium]